MSSVVERLEELAETRSRDDKFAAGVAREAVAEIKRLQEVIADKETDLNEYHRRWKRDFGLKRNLTSQRDQLTERLTELMQEGSHTALVQVVRERDESRRECDRLKELVEDKDEVIGALKTAFRKIVATAESATHWK